MQKKINPLGIVLACAAAIFLIGIITGAKQHFIGFLTLAGLAYALLTENTENKKSIR